eukprot:scaffold584_cov343-Prasinococcus_capsulatus_cf.AAC.8
MDPGAGQAEDGTVVGPAGASAAKGKRRGGRTAREAPLGLAEAQKRACSAARPIRCRGRGAPHYATCACAEPARIWRRRSRARRSYYEPRSPRRRTTVALRAGPGSGESEVGARVVHKRRPPARSVGSPELGWVALWDRRGRQGGQAPQTDSVQRVRSREGCRGAAGGSHTPSQGR